MPPETQYGFVADAIFTSPWAIMPEKHEAICAFIEAKLEGLEGDASGFVWSEPRAYLTDSGVRVIPVRGVMAKRMNLFTAISGGMSTEKMGARIQEAIEDEDVKAIVLDIDSPGGTVDGSFALSESVYRARGTKPIVAFADGTAASAGYLLASACDSIVATEVADVGSIGILTTHVDRSGADKKKGYVRTTVSAGEYKAVPSPDAPLDAKGRDLLQDRVDYIYGMFVDRVARNRGESVEKALSMADGKVFMGEQALDIGLVDSIGERGDAIALAESRIEKEVTRYDPLSKGCAVAISGRENTPYDPLTSHEGRNDR